MMTNLEAMNEQQVHLEAELAHAKKQYEHVVYQTSLLPGEESQGRREAAKKRYDQVKTDLEELAIAKILHIKEAEESQRTGQAQNQAAAFETTQKILRQRVSLGKEIEQLISRLGQAYSELEGLRHEAHRAIVPFKSIGAEFSSRLGSTKESAAVIGALLNLNGLMEPALYVNTGRATRMRDLGFDFTKFLRDQHENALSLIRPKKVS